MAFRSNSALARGGATPQVLRSGKQSAVLHVPGKDPLNLVGAEQVKVFESLVAAHKTGSPDVQVSELMKDCASNSPQQIFRAKIWASIRDVYITIGAKRGYWRLVVAGDSSEPPV
jgi:hypothetical protein